ncbi:enoyl-CoA hydratase/isomerase family protein [Corynebacterium camporealensis]
MASQVTTEKRNGVGILTIERERQLNALNVEVMDRISAALDEWEYDDEIDVVIFIGAGTRAFAAGADLQELASLSHQEVRERYPMAGLFDRIDNYRKPSIAAVNGIAFGGGFELALACDLRVASPTAEFRFPEVGLGIIPGAGGTQRLSRLLNESMATYLILSGEGLSAERAFEMGLVCRLDEDPLNSAIEIADTLRAKSLTAIRFARSAVKQINPSGHQKEQLYQGLAFASDDRTEGIDAFLSRRAPSFSATDAT